MSWWPKQIPRSGRSADTTSRTYDSARTIQGAVERIDLADLTAGEPSTLGFVESIDALTCYQVLDIAASGIVGADFNAIASFGGDPNRVGFLEQASGIERDDININSLLGKQMRDDLVLEPKAGREDDAANNFLPQ